MTCVGDSVKFFTTWLTHFKIYNCLDEYAHDGTFMKLAFEGTTYSSIYDTMLDLINDVKGSSYHCRKWNENRRRWATKGW